MRTGLLVLLLLLPSGAWALSEQEAHDQYVQCVQGAAAKLVPTWCHRSEKLVQFAHQSCLKEASAVASTARVRAPKAAVQNAQLDGQLATYGVLRQFKAKHGCEK